MPPRCGEPDGTLREAARTARRIPSTSAALRRNLLRLNGRTARRGTGELPQYRSLRSMGSPNHDKHQAPLTLNKQPSEPKIPQRILHIFHRILNALPSLNSICGGATATASPCSTAVIPFDQSGALRTFTRSPLRPRCDPDRPPRQSTPLHGADGPGPARLLHAAAQPRPWLAHHLHGHDRYTLLQS